MSHVSYREENRHGRILSVASDPQPEPEPDSHIFNQFSKIDAGFLAWDFPIHDARSEEIASVNRTWRGFGREVRIFITTTIPDTHLLS